MAQVCSPALWAKAETPTKGWCGSGATLTTSAMWCDTAVSRPRRSAPMVRDPHLEGQVGDGGRQIGVAGALAVAVDAALDLGDAHRGRPARELATAQPESLWKWQPSGDVNQVADLADDALDLERQAAAVGVAQHEDLGTGLGRRPRTSVLKPGFVW